MKNMRIILLEQYCTETPESLIKKIKEDAKRFSNPMIEVELDYTGCYYEGDHPTVNLIMIEKEM